MPDRSKLQVSPDELNLLEELAKARARESFLEFRRYIRPQLIVGWWVRDVAQKLQRFYNDFVAGNRRERRRPWGSSPKASSKTKQIAVPLAQ